MPKLTLPTDSHLRPLVRVEVKPSIPQQQALWANTPHQVPRVTVDFLIDTGATHCLIDEALIAAWRLPKINPKVVLSAGAPTAGGFEYDLALRLHTAPSSPSWHHRVVAVTAAPSTQFHGSPFQGLIGMDVLRLGCLHVDGPASAFELSWT